MRVVITGAAGQLGTELTAFCRGQGDEVLAADRSLLDVTDRDAVIETIRGFGPEAVVHAAAWTAVDACESDVGRAMNVNAKSVEHVADACAGIGAHLVHISTDYVFDGTKSGPYDEDDEPNPLSVYGLSKLEGERAAARTPSAVARTSWVVGRAGANIVKTMLRLLDGPDPLVFVSDQRGCPTVVADLVPVVRRLALERHMGTFHVTNQGSVSWFEFARLVAAVSGHDVDRVHPIETDAVDPPRPAPRPRNSVLGHNAMLRAGLPLLPHHEPSITALVSELAATERA
jgi:dTDP-4-dehydrorhamnose reductase